jgi:hypothetical protein
VGLPNAFVALCHTLSGGLPRDLIRVTRFLLSLNLTNFSEVCVPMVRRELFSRIPSLLRRTVELDSPAVFSILSWSERAASPWTDCSELYDRLKNLSDILSTLSSDSSMQAQLRATALRTCSEAEVVFLLGCTVLEYCCLVDTPTIPVDLSARLASLAVARQQISVHPALSAVRIL